MDHTKQLGTDPVLKLILRFSIPSIISMVVNAIYNFVDRLFIGQFSGEDALGGLTIAFPIMMIIFAFGALFSVGGAALISIKFGEHDLDEANKIYGNLAVLTVLTSIIMSIAGEAFLAPLLSFVGATENVLPYAQEYMQIILLGLVFHLCSFTMAALARSEGRPRLAMASQIASAVTNIILDYIFIGPLGMGVAGAAIATIIGQFVGFAILANHFFISKKGLLRLHIANLKLKLSIVRRICVIGASTFVINVGTSLSAAFMNVYLVIYGGDAAIVSLGIINSLIVLVLMPIFGLQQGIGPIIGYNHGMGQTDRVKKALWTGIGVGTVFAVIMTGAIEIIPEAFASWFLDPSSPTIAVCAVGLRLMSLFLPMLPITVSVTAYLQSTAQGTKGLVLSLSRQALVILFVVIFPNLWGLNGIWLSTPVSEFFAIALALGFLAYDKYRSAKLAIEEV